MTEDDTFRILKRQPVEFVYNKLHTDHYKSSILDVFEILRDCGWTFDEYAMAAREYEQRRRHDPNP